VFHTVITAGLAGIILVRNIYDLILVVGEKSLRSDSSRGHGGDTDRSSKSGGAEPALTNDVHADGVVKSGDSN